MSHIKSAKPSFPISPASPSPPASYFLFTHQNRFAPVRSNGLRFWGYPSRRAGRAPDIIVVHTAENIPDFIPPDSGAESVAKYFTGNARPASAHVVVDSDSTVHLLPSTAVAFHVRGYNTRGWGVEIATRAAKWGTVPVWFKTALLEAAAIECAKVASLYSIPVVFRTKAEVDSGLAGFTGHTNLDPTRRTDPGFNSNEWEQFLGLVTNRMVDFSNSPIGGDDMPFLPIKRGDGSGVRAFKRSDVAVIQSLLNDVYNTGLVEDGVYGDRTADAVGQIPGAAPSDRGSIVTGKMFASLLQVTMGATFDRNLRRISDPILTQIGSDIAKLKTGLSSCEVAMSSITRDLNAVGGRLDSLVKKVRK